MTGPAGKVFDKYWSAVSTGDAAGAAQVALQLRDTGVPLPEVLEQLVSAAQNEVGRLWVAGDWDVAHEHRATSVSEEVVAALSAGITTPQTGRSVIVTCADGEWHALPSRILAATLRWAGWRVTFLGASVPARQLTQLVHDVGPDVVAISCALPTRLRHARNMIEVARGAGVPVIVGGRGFGAGGRWGFGLGASAWAADAASALDALADLPTFVDPAPPMTAPDDGEPAVRAARDAVVARCMAELVTSMPPDVAAYDEQQLARTEEDLGHILDFLAAALYVDDVELYTTFMQWLRDLLDARHVPPTTLAAGLVLLERALLDRIGARSRVSRFLAAGRAVAEGGVSDDACPR